jgi:hypothetical protein
MEINSTRIQELVNRPGESLSVELKCWINPESPEGKSKIVRTVLALRNHDGGYFIIGFDDETLQPYVENAPADVQAVFHIDKIQGLISSFSSEPFEISVEFSEREGQLYPVIVVPSGVKTPVASKSHLLNPKGKDNLISKDEIYVRSLNSNNTPSSTKAKGKDWARIVDICFENREADIGRFLRRHLSGIKLETVREFASVISQGMEPEASVEDRLKDMLREGEKRFQLKLQERALQLPEHGSWEVAMLIVGDVPEYSTNKQFLNLLASNNPNFTGWPVWLDSRNFASESERPYFFKGAWEAFISTIGSGWFDHIDFMRFNPEGRFYLLRALEDDLPNGRNSPELLTVLDSSLPIIRSAEAIAVGIAFAKAMGCDPENTTLGFAFRWTHLQGRKLGSWATPGSYISGGIAHQDDVEVFVNVPLNVPLSALSEYVMQAIQPLFEVFDGFSISKEKVEYLTKRLIERRL